jgi:hypothetical protein
MVVALVVGGGGYRFRHPHCGQRRWVWWWPQLSHSWPGVVMGFTLVVCDELGDPHKGMGAPL